MKPGKYHRRLRKLVDALTPFGFKAKVPGGSYFLYTAAPKGLHDGRTFANAEEVSQYLITDRSICTVPWDDAGPFLRFSITYLAATERDEDNLMAELAARLSEINFVWV